MSTLETLLARLTGWMPVCDFEAAISEYFSGVRSPSEIHDYRIKRGKLKKLRDEVVPVLNHFRFTETTGEVRFQLNDSVPDCWLRSGPTSEPQGIEVTVAHSRAQYYIGKELNERRIARGFLGLSDESSSREFSERLATQRTMYSTDSALKAICSSIKYSLKKKEKSKYAGLDLLIEAPLHHLPRERWTGIYGELRLAAREMPFREIHIIGDIEPFGFRIK